MKTINEIAAKLEAAGCQVRISGERCYVNATPCGGRGTYGYVIATDDGTSGTCQGVTKRQGEIAKILRS